MSTPEQVNELLRQTSGQSVLLSAAIARHAGLSPADLEVLGTIDQLGPLTAGQLAELTGLSPAAVTGLIDRLERARVAERRPDPADRRRVLVRASAGAARIAKLYESLEADALRALRRRNAAELDAIADYLRDMQQIGVKHVARLQEPRRKRRI
jgi:DNA-binding MarR family transcriptional regulator